MTDDRLLHRWDKGSAGAKCIDCGVGAITPQGLQHCPGKSVEVQPRVWVGKEFMGTNWVWTGVWERFTHYCLYPGNIFVPDHCDEPTIDPAEMETIATAKKVDWS